VDRSRWRKRKMKGRMDLRRTGVVLCCLVAIVLSGCATARGVGQDTQSLGRSIEKKAQ
jgi:predicted small secreted protein